jgi:hypothetical protein
LRVISFGGHGSWSWRDFGDSRRRHRRQAPRLALRPVGDVHDAVHYFARVSCAPAAMSNKYAR